MCSWFSGYARFQSSLFRDGSMIEMVFSFASEFWYVLSEMAPYLLFGFLMAGLLSVLISAELIERHLGGWGVWPVVKSTVFGIPLPLCSCSVIPVAASLHRHGASRGATTAFLLSAPQTGVDSILVTFSLLGPVFAVFRTVAAFFTGLVGGSVVTLFPSSKAERSESSAPSCQDDCCTAVDKRGRVSRIFRYGFVTLPRDIGKALLVGLILAGLISSLVPDDYLSGFLGAGIGAMFVMMLLGVPVYVCATASVPVAAALIAKGISPGAALVFLMTGPATNAAAITTTWKMMGRRTAIIYLATVAITALAAGVLLDYIFTAQGGGAAPSMPGLIPDVVKTTCAFILLAVLGLAIYQRSRQKAHISTPPLEGAGITLQISGMTCDHCVQNVRDALIKSTGVQAVEVSMAEGKAHVQGQNLNISSLRQRIENLGYKVKKVENKDDLS